ncbi:GNAT family N-acetyltransferase [Mucilaginibacter glaciei]|uniref:GNAT family N-acetyltransferase n=1 Tax=Mucilaginibacter glaciei TaxID=2772109 RepID=A0A926NSR5_9SPHI|nr:GNAT family N-acetyltransferase [Mucilaginibacter glaciei]MBD1393285.1 GNAT family N-acetyltransferase [Mucilaginibacter glaciei]
MQLNIIIKPFSELSTNQLYNILRLRSEVFVVEQNCVYLDIDNKDLKCHHLMILDGDGELMAYARLVPPGLSFEEMSIGRVVSNSKNRGTGSGRLLMNRAIEECTRVFGNGDIKIGAQAYLVNFYSSFGFVPVGDGYDEDGIPHIDMIRQPLTKS